MRGGGFPCRYDGCQVRFMVQQSDSLPALLAASGERTAHEESAHGYHHISPVTEAPRVPFSPPRPRTERRAR